MPNPDATHVRSLRVKTGREAGPSAPQDLRPRFIQTPTAILTDCSDKKPRAWGIQMDRLLRNVAVAGALLLVIVAIRNTGATPTQSVFSALQSGLNMEWDESLGKLSFVSNLIPQSVQSVFGQRQSIAVLAPNNGEIVHAWSQAEPYIEMAGSVSDVRAAANGEIMSIAHGLEEEIILRIRHENNTETLYGNLATCFMEVGDYVFEGDIVGVVLDDKPLAFELRQDGRSIDPKGKLKSLED